ncbi:hypothetical protein EHS25_004784 [Saitozyma podzolica]|uniref:Transcription factor domain-containing protein n=1 Tax=Saitozyma podzolica TaxID=1890683 RepID=A0A427Y2N5_9TREE|nr:hypothetical protein EHS25_004784 [Saitozyma podzolica]
MLNTSVTTTDIPNTHVPSTYAAWPPAIEVALQVPDCRKVALGLDHDSTRARWIKRAPGAAGTVTARHAQPGPTLPEVSETCRSSTPGHEWPADTVGNQTTSTTMRYSRLNTTEDDSAAQTTAKLVEKHLNAVAETDFSQDPNLQGLLTGEDFNRLVALYFTKLRPFFLHLDPNVHTPNFLRVNSPFLTTAIAAVAASYDPGSFLLAPRLEDHAHYLASRAFAQGDKSTEVVQAFLTMVHWASCPSEDWLGNRSWMYQGQAMRLACEIRLDLLPDRKLLNTYRHTRGLTKDELDKLGSSRQKTYLLACFIATNSSRADTTAGHPLLRRPDLSFVVPIDEIDETFTASVRLSDIFGKALQHWHGMDRQNAELGERDRFVRSWRGALDEWRKDWMGKSCQLPHHAHPALTEDPSHESTQGLLRQICELAIQILVTILWWRDEVPFDAPGALAYAHNFLIVHIAAVLVHKLSRLLDESRAAEVGAQVMDTAALLDQIAAARSHAKSCAGYYAKQLRSLVHPGQKGHNLQPPQIVVTSASDRQLLGNEASDFSFLPIHYEFSLDASISDPILSFLAAPNISADGTWQWPPRIDAFAAWMYGRMFTVSA